MFDYENGQMQFAQNVFAYPGADVVGPPKPKTKSPGSKFAVVLIIFIIVVITIVALVFIWRCYSKSRARQDTSRIAYSQMDDGRY